MIFRICSFVSLGVFILWMIGMNVISNCGIGELKLQLIKYGGVVLVILIIIILCAIAGILISHHIAGPIYKFSQKTKEIKRGIITSEIILRENDEFVNLQIDFNDMMEGLEAIIKKDRTKIKEISQKLDNFCKNIPKIEKEEIISSLLEIKQEIQSLANGFVLSEDVKERESTR